MILSYRILLLLKLFLGLQYLRVVLLLLNRMIAGRSHSVLFASSIALKSASKSQFLAICWLFRLKITRARLVLLKVSHSHLSFLRHYTVHGLLDLVGFAEHDFGLADHGLLFNANLFRCFIDPIL